MAKSGTINGTTNNQYVVSKVSWSSTPDTAGNYSLVTATLYYSRTNSGYKTYGTWNGSITIDGKKTSGSKYITITQNSNTVAMTVSNIKVPHDSSGSKQCTISASGGISGTSFTSTTLSAKVTLDSIPRKATITSAPNFTDEASPVVKFSNLAGNSVTSLKMCISTTTSASNAIVAYKTISSKTATSYTFSFTSDDKTALQNACNAIKKNSRTVYFILQTVIGNVTYTHVSGAKTLSIANPNPTLSPTVANSLTTLTGSPNILIKYVSSVNYAMNDAAVKGATIVSRKVTCGGKSSTARSGSIHAVESGKFTFSVTDSRGNTETEPVEKTLIPYVKLTCKLAVLGPDAGGNMTVTISGDCFKGSFGAVDNTLDVYYRIIEDDGTSSDWLGYSTTPSDNNRYSRSIPITGLDYKSQYTVEAYAIDKVYQYSDRVEAKPITVTGTPVFDWSKKDFRVNVTTNLMDNVVIVNDKGVCGRTTDGVVYNALSPITASDNTSLGYGLYNAGRGHTHIYGNDVQFYTKTGKIHTNSNDIIMNNQQGINGIYNGKEKNVFIPMSSSGNAVIGYDLYESKEGNTNIYGHDIVHFVSNIATPGSYRPYRRRGDVQYIFARTTGWVTNGGTEVHFTIPFTAPIIGSPTTTATSRDGFIIRQNDKYLYGSAASTYVSPTSYEVTHISMWNGISIKAVFSNTTNVLNNSPVGIQWSGTITFS